MSDVGAVDAGSATVPGHSGGDEAGVASMYIFYILSFSIVALLELPLLPQCAAGTKGERTYFCLRLPALIRGYFRRS